MAEIRSLAVWVGPRKVGRLERAEDYTFAYHPEASPSDAVSLTMPVRLKSWQSRPPSCLPDEPSRRCAADRGAERNREDRRNGRPDGPPGCRREYDRKESLLAPGRRRADVPVGAWIARGDSFVPRRARTVQG